MTITEHREKTIKLIHDNDAKFRLGVITCGELLLNIGAAINEHEKFVDDQNLPSGTAGYDAGVDLWSETVLSL